MNSDSNKVGVLISTVADDGAIKTTQAELTVLGDTAKKSSATATTAFDSFNSSLKKMGTEATAAGRSMTEGISLPLAAVGGISVKMAMDFQQSMTYVRTDAGDTTDNIDTLSKSVLNLAKTSQFSPDELANGLYHLASLGLRGADAMSALNTAQKMAAVGGSDLESTASALGGALVSGINGVQNYTQAAGVLDATIGAGNMRMQDLVNAIGTGVLPVFKNAGLSITDFGAALATLTDNGQDASAAATHLRMTISLMEAPSDAAAGAMEKIGLTSNQLGMDMQTKGLVPALKDLQQHLLKTYGTTESGKQQMAAALNDMFGGGKSSAAIQTLLDQLDRVQNKETQISSQSGEFAQKYKEQQATASAQFKTAWDGIQASLIQFGDVLMPSVAKALTQITTVISDVSKWFEGLSKGQQQFVIDTAGVVMAVGPALLIFGKLAKSLSEILTLSKSVGVAMGLIGSEGSIGGVAKIAGGLAGSAEAAGGMAAAGGAGEAAAGAAAAMTGPVGLALLGTAAAVTTGIVLWKKYSDNVKDTTHGLGLTAKEQVVANKALTDGNAAVEYQTKMENKSSQQTIALTKARNELSATNVHITEKTKQLADAEELVQKNYDKYGASSPQYKDALKKVSDLTKGLAKDNTNLKTQTENVKKAEDDLEKTHRNLSSATKDVENKTYTAATAQAALRTAQADLKSDTRKLNDAKAEQIAILKDFGKNSPEYARATLAVAAAEQQVGDSASYASNEAKNLKNIMDGIVTNADGAITKFDTTGMTAHAAANQHTRGYALNAQGVAVPMFAGGSSGTPGGDVILGEDGPERVKLPAGSKVLPARQTSKMGGNTTHNHFSGNIVLGTEGAVKQFFKQMNADSLLASKGMSVRQGN